MKTLISTLLIVCYCCCSIQAQKAGQDEQKLRAGIDQLLADFLKYGAFTEDRKQHSKGHIEAFEQLFCGDNAILYNDIDFKETMKEAELPLDKYISKALKWFPKGMDLELSGEFEIEEYGRLSKEWRIVQIAVEKRLYGNNFRDEHQGSGKYKLKVGVAYTEDYEDFRIVAMRLSKRNLAELQEGIDWKDLPKKKKQAGIDNIKQATNAAEVESKQETRGQTVASKRSVEQPRSLQQDEEGLQLELHGGIKPFSKSLAGNFDRLLQDPLFQGASINQSATFNWSGKLNILYFINRQVGFGLQLGLEQYQANVSVNGLSQTLTDQTDQVNDMGDRTISFGNITEKARFRTINMGAIGYYRRDLTSQFGLDVSLALKMGVYQLQSDLGLDAASYQSLNTYLSNDPDYDQVMDVIYAIDPYNAAEAEFLQDYNLYGEILNPYLTTVPLNANSPFIAADLGLKGRYKLGNRARYLLFGLNLEMGLGSFFEGTNVGNNELITVNQQGDTDQVQLGYRGIIGNSNHLRIRSIGIEVGYRTKFTVGKSRD